MTLPNDCMLLRIYLSEDAKSGHQPLYESIVMKARDQKLAGATVLRGMLGFGHSTHIHTAKILELSQDLPLVIEIVDSEAHLLAFLEAIDGSLESCLVTLEKVRVLRYGPKNSSTSSG